MNIFRTNINLKLWQIKTCFDLYNHHYNNRNNNENDYSVFKCISKAHVLENIIAGVACWLVLELRPLEKEIMFRLDHKCWVSDCEQYFVTRGRDTKVCTLPILFLTRSKNFHHVQCLSVDLLHWKLYCRNQHKTDWDKN